MTENILTNVVFAFAKDGVAVGCICPPDRSYPVGSTGHIK